MTFLVQALSPEPFAPLFALDEAALAARQARLVVADESPGYPCRVSLADAALGTRLLLVHFEHQPADTPYRASHAIFVREGAARATPEPGEVPDALASRLLSVRAFGPDHFLRDADVIDGTGLAALADRLLDDRGTAYLHVHHARQGCYAARVERA